MVEFADAFSNKLRLLAAGLLIIICLVMLPFLPGLLAIPTAQAANNKSSAAEDAALSDSPNAITRGMFSGVEGLERAAGSAEQTVVSGSRSAANATIAAATTSAKFAASTIGSGVSLAARGVGGSVAFIGKTASGAISFMGKTSSVGAIIRPADSNSSPSPVIESNYSDHDHSASAIRAGTSQTVSQPPVGSGAQWPMRGVITTVFGVPHWPYQPTHTGIDISDQKASGTTPILPFKPGAVEEIVRSNVGLGNHVVVDHGAGITSVYAHLSSIAVRVGQKLYMDTVLGYAGSTGASTGTHLHFEIKVNGQSVDPRRFITGQP